MQINVANLARVVRLLNTHASAMRNQPALVNISLSLRPHDRMKLGALRANIDFGAAERVVILKRSS